VQRQLEGRSAGPLQSLKITSQFLLQDNDFSDGQNFEEAAHTNFPVKWEQIAFDRVVF
jgi:hypothetical protein